jgi:folate-binding protein YgfZ
MCERKPVPSPFEADLRARGAVMIPVEDGQYPARFAHPFAEHKAARTAAALFDVSFLGKLEIAGPDAKAFLHRLASADLSRLSPGQGGTSYLLSAQGKIRHSFDALATPDGFLLISEGSAVPELVEDLEKFRFGESATLRDFTAVLGALLLTGPKAGAVLARAVEGAPPAGGEHAHGFVKIASAGVLAALDGRAGMAGYLLLVPAAAAAAVLTELTRAGEPDGLVLAGLTAFDALRIEAGRARFGLDYTRDHFPQEVGREEAFSLNKGCYPGQETVARIDSYGRVHRQLRGLVLDSPKEDVPEHGDRLLAGEEDVGEVRSWAISPLLERPVALAVVKSAKAPVGSDLAIRSGGRELTAKVTGLPIVAPTTGG